MTSILARHRFNSNRWALWAVVNGSWRLSYDMPLLCKNGIYSTTEVFTAPRACLTGCAPPSPVCLYRATCSFPVAGTRLSYRVGCCCWYQIVIQSGLLLLVPGCHWYRVGCCCWYQAIIQSGLQLLVSGCHTEWVAIAGTSLSYRVRCYCWYKSVIHNLLLLFVLGYPDQVGLLLVLLGCPYRAGCLVAGGGTQLSFRGCWLAFGGTQLSFRGCWLAGGGTQLSFRGCWLAGGGTQLSFRGCWLAGGGTQLSSRGCLVAGGGTRLSRDGADGRVATAGLWR